MNSTENDPGAPGIAGSQRTDPNLKMHRLLMHIDFTPGSLHALRSSARMSEKMGGAVCLPHVVNCRATIEAASSENSDLTIMAIHDHKGLQRVFPRVTCQVDRDTCQVERDTCQVDRDTCQVETEVSCQVLTLHRLDANEVEPKLWKGTVSRGSASGWGRCF